MDSSSVFPHKLKHLQAQEEEMCDGLSLRDYFAAKAMQTLISQYEDGDRSIPAYVIEKSFLYADEMLKYRKENQA